MDVSKAAMEGLQTEITRTRSRRSAVVLENAIALRGNDKHHEHEHDHGHAHGHAAHSLSETLKWAASIMLPSCSAFYFLIRNAAHDRHALHSWLVIACMAIVVFLTWAFEEFHHALEHWLKGNDQYEKVMAVLMQEVTLLGFISFCLFLAVKSGTVAVLSTFLLPNGHGHGHGDKHNHEHVHAHDSAHAIVEVFEEVHVLVFLVMVFLLVLDVWLLHGTRHFQRKITSLSEGSPPAIRKEYYNELQKLIHVGARVKVYLLDKTSEGVVKQKKDDPLILAWYVQCDGQSEYQEFLAKDVQLVRQAGIWHRVVRLFIARTPLEAVERQLAHRAMRREFHSALSRAEARQFKFSVYLTECYTDLVLKLIKVEPTSHMVVLLVAICVRPVFLWTNHYHFSLAMVAFPTCLLLVLLVLRLKMDSIEEQLTPPLKRILEEDGIKARTFKCGLHSSSYPKSKQQKKQEQEQLFWFGRHGPLFLERSVQMVLLLVVCFAAAYIGSLSGMGVTWSSVMSFLVNSLVVGVLLWILPSTLHVLTLITSIEEMKKRKHINGTMELVHQELHVQILQMLLLLKGHNVVKWAKKVQPGDAAAERQRLYRQVADQEILKTLADDAFRAGCIGRCVRHFGFFLTDVEIQNIINSMQDCGICTKGVSTSNEDFYVILAALEEQKGKVMDLESLRALFDEIDLTHSGTISAHELHQALTRYSEGADTLGVGKEDCRAFIREARHFAGEMEGEEAEEVTLEALIKWIKSLENRLCTHILAD